MRRGILVKGYWSYMSETWIHWKHALAGIIFDAASNCVLTVSGPPQKLEFEFINHILSKFMVCYNVLIQNKWKFIVYSNHKLLWVFVEILFDFFSDYLNIWWKFLTFLTVLTFFTFCIFHPFLIFLSLSQHRMVQRIIFNSKDHPPLHTQSMPVWIVIIL